MKTRPVDLMRLLAARFAAAKQRDADDVPGVYAVPGPRAQGDESVSPPALSAELLDEVRISKLPDLPADMDRAAGRRLGGASPVVQITLPSDPDDGGDGDAN